MGIDLQLMVLSYGPRQLGEEKVEPSPVFRMIRRYDTLGQIISLPDHTVVKPRVPTMPVPPNLTVLRFDREKGEVWERRDGRDNEYTFAYAKDLATLDLGDDPHPFNQAIVAYLAAIPGDTPVILRSS